MASSVNPDQTPRSEGVRPGSTLFAQGLESIKSPVCSIYAPIMFFLQRVGGAGRGGAGRGQIFQSYPTPGKFNRKFWHTGGISEGGILDIWKGFFFRRNHVQLLVPT